ncbi:MAG: PepSY domain-containing protein [Clostridia bacterium]|nr:PepSY domain-containing protein [Clostridia bacterium]
MKKFFALATSAVLVLALFAGCTSNDSVESAETTAAAVNQTEAAIHTEVHTTEAITEASTVTVEATEEVTVKPTEAKNSLPDTKPVPEKPQTTPGKSPSHTDVKISKDEAKIKALAHAGLSESDISRYKSELDRERGTLVYEIEFDSGKYEYEYEVDANNGKIIKSEKEFRD